jgi:uncharacterized protein (DUF58 family)
MAQRAPGALLDARFVERLERLALLARRPVRGWVAGRRRSRASGHSVEFRDHRAYGAGDDLRYLDWNVYGRTDRLHVKRFVDDEDLCLHLLLDASASMDWGEPSKLGWAARVAAALGFVALASLERVAFGVLRARLEGGWPPARGRARISALFEALASVRGEGTTDLDAALADYARRAPPGGVAVVLSDLLAPRGYERGLAALAERRLEVHVVHVLGPEDFAPSLAGDLRLVDHETGEVRELCVDAETRREYRARLEAFCARAAQYCRAHEIGYYRASSATAPEEMVFGPLRGRLLA